jgi:hypothetical protein
MNNLTIFKDVALSASRGSQWVDTQGAYAAKVQLSWVGTGGPTGAYTIEYSQDPVCEKEKLTAVPFGSTAARRVDITAEIPADDIVGTGLSLSGTDPGDTLVTLLLPARFFRVVYTRDSGGSAASLSYGWVQLIEAAQ